MLKINANIGDSYLRNEDTLEDINRLYLMQIYSSIIIEVDKLVDGMSHKNFTDEALQYLTDNKLNTDKETVQLFSRTLFEEFKKIYPKLIEINFEDNSIYISSSIGDFEYGTAFKPALLLLTHAVSTAIKELD